MKVISTKSIRFFVLATSMLLEGDAKATEISLNETITYQNQRESILLLSWHHSDVKSEPQIDETKDDKSPIRSGSLTGTFTSAVGEKTALGYTTPIVGFYTGNAITIAVNLPPCERVIAMTGNTTDDHDEIHMHWLVTAHAIDPCKTDWNCHVTGYDHYKRLV